MIRAFLAVELDEALRQRIARVQQDLREPIHRETSGAIRIAWVRPASIHLTLKFLGDIDEQGVDLLRDAIAGAIHGHRATQMPLTRLGAFPRPQAPRALWMGASEPWERGEDGQRLAALQRAIEDCCEALAFPREHRPFSPHLTLARVKAGERQVGHALATLGAIDRPLTLGPLAVEAVALMRSQLLSTGAVHTRLWEARLNTGVSQR